MSIEYGAHNWTRTSDLSLTKGVLYRLSYMGKPARQDSYQWLLERETGIEPASSAWKAEVLPLNYSRLDRTADSSRSPPTLKLRSPTSAHVFATSSRHFDKPTAR